MKRILSVGLLVVGLVVLASCGSTTSGTSSCAAGSNDFYVVENASCTSGAGKLSRINPTALCKEEILTGLNCPVDFVLSSVDSGIGYLSSRTDGVFQVNLTQKTTTHIATTTNIVSPTSLFLMENITESERAGPCGGNTLVDAILMVADEGTDIDGGMVWRWCLITDDPTILSDGSNPSPVSEVGPAQIKHPRGVVVKGRTQVYASGLNPDNDNAMLFGWTLNSAQIIVPNHLTTAGAFSSTIKDVALDADGNVLVADAGNSAVLRYNTATTALTTLTPSLTGGPRDVVYTGSGGSYLVTQFTDGVVSQTTFETGSSATTVTTGLTLSGPDGIAKP